MSEVEERIQRIQTHKGVKGLLIVRQDEKDASGLPQFVKSTFAKDQE